MNSAEELVLMMAALLGAFVFEEETKSALAFRTGTLLYTLAVLASIAALVHMFAR